LLQKNSIIWIPFLSKLCYNFSVTAPKLATEGGVFMEVILSFVATVVAGVVCHYIIKWLDGRK